MAIKLYVVDLEVLFSANPFLSTASENDNFKYLKANHTFDVKLNENSTKTTVAIPE